MVEQTHESEERAPLEDMYVQGFIALGRSMSLAATTAAHPSQAPAAMLAVWQNAVHEVLSTWHGLERTDAMEQLYELAVSRNLDASYGVDRLQEILAHEALKAPRPKPNGNGAVDWEEHDRERQDSANGVAMVFPCPLETTMPRRPWKVPGFLLGEQLTLLVAPPGSGKSLLTLQVALMCATGLPWGNWRPRGPLRVLVINAEEDEWEMRRRLFAAAQMMGLHCDQAMPNFAIAARPESIVIAIADHRTKTVTRTPMVEKIVASIKQHKFDILVVDPFAETFIGDENDNSELKWAAMLWREVARRTGCAILLVHHAKKYSNAMAGDMDAARGGGSLLGVARIVCTLFGMTKEEAERMGVQEEIRNRYLRFDDAKANITLVSFRARWFEKVTVTLPNAGEDEPADDVGVLVPWMPNLAFDLMTEAQANAILDAFEVGYRGEDGTSEPCPFAPNPEKHGKITARWGGLVIQQQLMCNEQQAREILNTWVKAGVLLVIQQVIPRGAKHRKRGEMSACLKVITSMRPGRILDHSNLADMLAGSARWEDRH